MIWNWKSEKTLFLISPKYSYFKLIFNYTKKGLWKRTLTKNMNPIHFLWFGELFKHTYFVFKCISVNKCIQNLHGSKKIIFHTFVCVEISHLKNTSQFKTTNFEYSKTSTTLKRYNRKTHSITIRHVILYICH
jgi:hypothetical protein